MTVGKLVEWDKVKGYGFLQAGENKVFLHWRDFAERHKRPTVGDVVQFTLGKDAKGRPCAKNAMHINDGGQITVLVLVVWAGLLVLPALACWHCGLDLRWAGLYAGVMSAASYAAYAMDKRRAQQDEWRISEGKLHLTELLGGWPGAFLAQRRMRHKCSKSSYQFMFWLIVLAWQFAAADSLQNWEYSKIALNFVERAAEHRR